MTQIETRMRRMCVSRAPIGTQTGRFAAGAGGSSLHPRNPV